MLNQELKEKCLNEFLHGEFPFGKICKKLDISKEELEDVLCEYEYFYIKNSHKRFTVTNIHDAAMEFIEKTCFNITFTEVAHKYGLNGTRFREYLEKWYPNLQLKRRDFNENIFDVIDSEEKAYWLGFIYADGYIASAPLNPNVRTEYSFELSLASFDFKHLQKFADFIGYKQILYCDSKRCRLKLGSKHFWNTLNNLGCTPQKTLTLKFPKLEYFSNPSLIRHFIRGYWDGDGTLTWSNKEHTIPQMDVISTEDVLNGIQKYFIKNKVLSDIKNIHNNTGDQDITKRLMYYAHKAFRVGFFLYENSNVVLDRKKEIYLVYCRLYKELYRQLQTENGEICDDNPVLSSEIKESEPMQSVEIEPEKSE